MERIAFYFPELTAKQIEQFKALDALYHFWNSKINLISRKDINNLYSNHVLHSLSIAKYAHYRDGDEIIDVGTGGGFPGLPLAILVPNVSFMLVDSVGKKINVVKAVIDALDLQNVTVAHARVEEIDRRFDYAVSRAVTKLDIMWGWVAPLLNFEPDRTTANGLLYLKGGNISKEIPSNCIVQQIPITTLLDEPQFIEKTLVHIYKK